MAINNLDLSTLPMRYDYYQHGAETWSQLFNKINLSKKDVVLDLLSGWSPKIALGLSLSNFSGKLIAVDVSNMPLQIYQGFVDPIIKSFSLITKSVDILNSPLPKAKFIIGNHIIEDIILYQHLKKKHQNPNPYQAIPSLKKYWQQINLGNINLNQLSHSFVANLTQSLSRNGAIIFSQYPGYQETLHRLEKPSILSQKLLTIIEESFKNHGFKRDHITPKQVLEKIKNPYFKHQHVYWFRKD